MPNNRQELIPIQKRGESEQWVDARTLHKFLQVGKDFSNWIKDYITDFGFIEGRDFSPNLAKSTGGRQAIEYAVTIDMAKHLAMLQRNEKGMQARQYFIQAEKELRRLQTALLSGYDELQALLSKCKTKIHNGQLYYAAGQLKTLAGKSVSSNSKTYELAKSGLAVKLPEGLQLKWYVKENAVNQLLCIKSTHRLSVAIVNLMEKGGTQ